MFLPLRPSDDGEDTVEKISGCHGKGKGTGKFHMGSESACQEDTRVPLPTLSPPGAGGAECDLPCVCERP